MRVCRPHARQHARARATNRFADLDVLVLLRVGALARRTVYEVNRCHVYMDESCLPSHLLHAALSQVLVVYMGERDDGSAITGRFRIQQVKMRCKNFLRPSACPEVCRGAV